MNPVLDMEFTFNPVRQNVARPIQYEIKIRDVLDNKWENYFAPFTLIYGRESTLIMGVVRDQAELFGILLQIRDLGLSLISVNPVRKTPEN